MSRQSVITLVIIVSVVCIAGWYAYFVTQKANVVDYSDSAAANSLQTRPDQTPYTDINGNQVYLDDYLGKVLVVNSWASWCPACAQVLPELSKLGQQYETQGVVVLAINRAEPVATAQSFLRSVNAVEGVKLVLDPSDRYFGSVDGFTMPETLFYDTNGNVVVHKRGPMNFSEMSSYVQKIITVPEVINEP